MLNAVKSAMTTWFAVVGAVMMATAGYAAETEITEDKTVLGDWTVEVAEGDVVRVSAVQSGSGKIIKNGAGSLILAANNTFSGGVMVNAGTVEPHHGNAFGTGKIILNADGAKECRIAFTKGKLTFANDLELVGTSAIGKPAFYFNAGTNVWNGKITAPSGDFYMCDNGDWAYISTGGTYANNKFSGGSWSNKVAPIDFMTFNGEINVSGVVYIVPDGHMVFNGPIKCDTLDTCYRTGLFTLHGKGDTSFYGDIEFNGVNAVRQFNVAYSDRHFIERGLEGAIVHWPLRTNHENGSPGSIYLNGSKPNRLAGFTSVFPRTSLFNYGNIRSHNNQQIVVTGKGANENENNTFACHSALGPFNADAWGKFNFAVDGTGVNPGFTQVFSNRHHNISGMLGATNGTLRLVGESSSCSNVTTLVIGENGTIENETSVPKSFARVTRIAIGATGTLKLGGRFWAETFDTEKIDLELGSGATIEAPMREGEILQVNTLKIDGIQKQSGAYAASDLGVNLPAGLQIVAMRAIESSAEAVWTGEGADNSMTTLKNWKEVAALPDITSSSTKVTIESGEAMIPAETGRTALGEIEWQIPITDDGKPFVLGEKNRTLEVAGRIVNYEKAQMIVRGTIAPLDGVETQGTPSQNDDNKTFYYRGMLLTSSTWPSTYVKSSDGYYYVPLVLDDATIAKPYYSHGENSKAGCEVLHTLASTVNRFVGQAYFYAASWTQFRLNDNSTLEFTSPVTANARIALKGSGTMIISAPWTNSDGAGLGFQGSNNGCKLIIDAENNWFGQNSAGCGLYVRESSYGAIEFRRSHCLAAHRTKRAFPEVNAPKVSF